MRHQSDLEELLDTDREEAPVGKKYISFGERTVLGRVVFFVCGQICIHGSETWGIQEYLLRLRLNFAAENKKVKEKQKKKGCV